MQESAELCGGRLRFFTKPGKGTIATLRMPKIRPSELDELALS